MRVESIRQWNWRAGTQECKSSRVWFFQFSKSAQTSSIPSDREHSEALSTGRGHEKSASAQSIDYDNDIRLGASH